MKKVIQILSIILIISLSFSCSNEEKKKGLKYLNSFVTNTYAVQILIPEEIFEDVEMIVLPEPVYVETNYYDNVLVEVSESFEIIDDLILDTLIDSHFEIEEGLDFSETTTLIDNLLIRVDYFKNSEFTDCEIVESEIISISDFYFEIIKDIHLNDTSNVKRLEDMESLLEVFSVEIDDMEAQCPDIYNNFMEYLEDMVDDNYEKLNLLFDLSEV